MLAIKGTNKTFSIIMIFLVTFGFGIPTVSGLASSSNGFHLFDFEDQQPGQETFLNLYEPELFMNLIQDERFFNLIETNAFLNLIDQEAFFNLLETNAFLNLLETNSFLNLLESDAFLNLIDIEAFFNLFESELFMNLFDSEVFLNTVDQQAFFNLIFFNMAFFNVAFFNLVDTEAFFNLIDPEAFFNLIFFNMIFFNLSFFNLFKQEAFFNLIQDEAFLNMLFLNMAFLNMNFFTSTFFNLIEEEAFFNLIDEEAFFNLIFFNLIFFNLGFLNLPFMNLPFLNLPFLNLPFFNLIFLNLPFLNLIFFNLPFLNLPFLNLPFLNLIFLNLPFLNLRNWNIWHPNRDRNRGLSISKLEIPWNVQKVFKRGYTGDKYDEPVQIAILDTGIDTEHPDLASNIKWTYDATGGGFEDHNGHGTHVAGTIGATRDNFGVAGIYPNAEIYSIKVIDSVTGEGEWEWLEDALYKAVAGPDGVVGNDDDADIINMSFGSGDEVPPAYIHTAIKFAYDHDIALVGAGGNGGDGDASTDEINYPAAYPEVIAVSSLKFNGKVSDFSASGPYIEIAAPGEFVFSTYLGGSYAYWGGTSMATPHVTGVIALIIAKYGKLPVGDMDDKNRETIRGILHRYARNIGTRGWDESSGYGLVQFK